MNHQTIISTTGPPKDSSEPIKHIPISHEEAHQKFHGIIRAQQCGRKFPADAKLFESDHGNGQWLDLVWERPNEAGKPDYVYITSRPR